MHSHNKLTTIMMIVLMLLAGCRQATVAPPPQATTSLAPVATPMQVTVVATSAPTATPVPTNTPKPTVGAVLLVFGQDFIYNIYAIVRPALEEAGYHVVVASRTMGPLKGKNVNLEADVDLLLQEVQVEEYDAILFNCDNDITFGSARAETDRITQEAVAQGKVLAAICTGPRVLAYADVVEGLQTTGEPSQTCAMLEQSGATCTGAEVERDGLIITARDRYASHAFARTILEAMREQFVTPPFGGGGKGLIAFVSDRDGNGEIYVMNADGSDQRRLTHFGDFDGVPTWSPDGKQLAFYTHLSYSKWIIQAMDADGSNQRALTDNDACDGAPFWSPDGTRIAFTAAFDCDPDNREIVIMNADGSSQVKLTDNDIDDYLSAWSPDSQQIAFVSDRDGNDEIYIVNADGSDPRRLTDSPSHDHMPAWSPNGEQIAFVSDRAGNDDIYVIDVNGENVRQLTNHPSMDWFPFWSLEGAQLLFNSKRDGGDLDVYVMNADGTDIRRLTDNPGQDFNAVWQPRPAGGAPARDSVDTWVKTYAGDPIWAALDGLPTADGGYLLVGSTNYSHHNARQEDVYLVRTDPAGEIVWAKAYGGDDFDRGNRVIQADDGGFVLLGETASSGAGDWDMLLLKVDVDGNELWSTTFGGPAQERGNALQRTTDGGYILIGSTKSFGAGGSDLYLVKTDDLGNEVWSQTYGGELDEEGNDVHHSSDGGFFVLAQVLQSARLYTDQNPDIFLLRTDEAGNEIWSQVWEEENVEGGHVLLPTSDGNYIVVGITSSAGSEGDIDFLFLKIDTDGNLIWDKPISDESAVDYGIDVVETSDGGYLITGMFSGGDHGAIPLIKTDGTGQVLWTRKLIEGWGNKAGMRVFPTPDGGYVIIGNTDEYRRVFETVLIKTDSEGNVNE